MTDTPTPETLDALQNAHDNLDSLLAQAIRFIETLADNDPDDLIADNGMTVVGALQYQAPPLSFAMRAARNNLPALIEAARGRDALRAENERLRLLNKRCIAMIANEREDNLWGAYATGFVKDGFWYHSFISDGEALAVECGLDPKIGKYPDGDIRAAIPAAARRSIAPYMVGEPQ